MAEVARFTEIAIGEIEDAALYDGKDPAAKALGVKGGKKRVANLSPERRKEIAKKAAASCLEK